MKKGCEIKVMLADYHDIFRDMVGKYLKEGCENISVTGAAHNGVTLLGLMEKNAPDIVLLDLEMLILENHKTLARIKEEFPGVKPIVLCIHYNKVYLAQLAELGVCGYLLKSCFDQDFALTIEKVYNEGYCFNGKISVNDAIDVSVVKNQHFTDCVLTKREIEVLKLICNGKLYKEVAEALNLSHDTVKFHIKSIYKKTGVHSIALLVKYAIRVGITTIA